MSLVDGTSALAQTSEVANTLKVVSESTQQTAEVYSISQYLTETQADQPQAALTAWKYIDSLQTYVPQVVTGLTATATGTYEAVAGGLAYVLSVPAAFAAIAGALGLGVGVGMYQANPTFWDRLSERLISEGAMVGDGILSFVSGGKNYIPESTINIIKQFLIEEGAYNDGGQTSSLVVGQPIEFTNTRDSVRTWINNLLDNGRADYDFARYNQFSFDAIKTGFNWLITNAPDLPSNGFYYLTFTLSTSGNPYRYSMSIYVLEKPSDQRLLAQTTTGSPYFRDADGNGSKVYISGVSGTNVFNVLDTVLTYSFALYSYITSTTYYTQPSQSSSTPSTCTVPSSSNYLGMLPGALNGMGRVTLGFLGVGLQDNPAVEGLNKESGATYPDETKTIPEEYPNWANDGMTFLRPKTREIGENPRLNPDDVEEFRALPVEIPAITGNPANEGLEEGQQIEQGGVIDDPPIVGPLPPDWKRIIVGTDNIIDVYPPKPPIEDDPPILDVPENTDPPTDPPVDPPIDDGGVNPPVVPPISTLGTGMNNVYNPTKAQMQEFNAFLWSNDFIDNIKKILNDPMEAVIALQMVYCTPATESGHTIVVGSLDTEISSDIVTSQYVTINCGSVTIPEYFRDYTDYSPYTQVLCFLPFVGFVNLETDDIIGSTVNIEYTVDLYTGTCLAEITVTRNNMSAILYSFNGNCAVQIPLTSGTHNSIFGVLSGLSTVGLGLGTGNPLMVLSGLATAGVSFNKNDVSRSGNLGSNAGAMGVKTPYIIVRRPVAYNAQQYNEYIGIPSNTTVKLGTLNGYTRIREVHVELIEKATDAEKDLIYNLLREGVIF